MSGMSPTALTPTWNGHIHSAREALILFEACLVGELHHVPRRPHDRERSQLIRSGSVFIYEENASGIKRWTDGVPWSPSRLLGNFLIYRELQHPFPPGEKKRATKKKNRTPRPPEVPASSGETSNTGAAPVRGDLGIETREQERALIGSLVDSYLFKEDGLIKKTMSVTLHGISHHLVSYYTVRDVVNGSLITPTADSRLSSVVPRNDLMIRQNFRTPVEENGDGLSEHAGAQQQGGYMYSDTYDRPGMMLPSPPSNPSPQGSMQMGYGQYHPAAPSLASGLHHYDANNLASPSSYYHQGQNIPSPTRSQSFDRSGSFPHPQNYGYRPTMQDSMAPTAAARGHHANGWDRSAPGQEPLYAGGQHPQQGMNPNAYSSAGPAWSLSSPGEGLSLPPPTEGWPAGENGWPPMNQNARPAPNRINGYSRGHNGYNGMGQGYSPPSSKP